MSGYAHPELLVDTAWLAERLTDPGVRIVDCDVRDMYARAHIPGAVSVEQTGLTPSHYLKDPENERFVLPPDAFAEVMGRLGIGDDTLVVAYDASGSLYSARLWWALTYHGHTQVVVLDGGWDSWLREGRPVSNQAVTPPAAIFTPHVRPDLIVLADDLAQKLGQPGVALWDVRSEPEHAGTATRGNRRTGHMPGATNLEWRNSIDWEQGQRFKPAEALQAQLESLGITPEKEVVTY